MSLSWFRAAVNALVGPRAPRGWVHLCKLNLRGAHLQMVELRIVGARHEVDSVVIPAKLGRYLVEYQVMSFSGDRRVSRMRVRPRDVNVSLGQELGAIDVDWGGVAVTDVDVLAPSVEAHLEEYDRWFMRTVFDNHEEPVGVVRWTHSRTPIPYADGGFGDGTYSVYELRANGRPVGLEVEFIAPGEKYPF